VKTLANMSSENSEMLNFSIPLENKSSYSMKITANSYIFYEFKNHSQ